MHYSARFLSLPLLTMALIFGVPRNLHRTADATADGTCGYATASTAPNPAEQAPREITPDRASNLPELEPFDPDPNAEEGTSSEVSP
jgi:hypothetical protein